MCIVWSLISQVLQQTCTALGIPPCPLWLFLHLFSTPACVSILQHNYQLFCGFTGCGRHAGRPLRNDFQCLRRDIWQMDVWLAHVRHLEQLRCLLLHCQHNAFVLHFGRQVSAKGSRLIYIYLYTIKNPFSLQVLCHRAATGLSIDNDASPCVHHAANGLAIAGAALIPAHLLGLVYDQRELEISQIKSACKSPPSLPVLLSLCACLCILYSILQRFRISNFVRAQVRGCVRVPVCPCACVPIGECRTCSSLARSASRYAINSQHVWHSDTT